MTDEAPLKSAEHGTAPDGDGWFVVNARESRWLDDGGLGYYTPFEGEKRFPKLAINLAVLEPGQPNGMYHGEQDQEDFLVLAGECLLLIEGEERRLRAWDFVHCPPWTEHIFVGAGDGPCTILMVSTRTKPDDIIYPESELAQRHGAGVDEETTSAAEAYEKFPNRKQPTPFRDAWLPDF